MSATSLVFFSLFSLPSRVLSTTKPHEQKVGKEHKYKDKDEYKDNDKDKDAKKITESLTECYIFGILTTQAFQV